MTLDEAIKHAEEVADKKEREKQKWERWLKTDSDYRAVTEKVNCELCAEEHRQLAEWLKDYKRLLEQPRWIPVSERLPNIGETVLCQCQVNIYEVLKLTVDGWYHDNEHCYMEGFVIAWQPLPQPYKTESEG